MKPDVQRPIRVDIRVMANGGRDAAGEPLYWAIARLIHDGGMPAVTVRAAAAEAGCSVGLMRHYYDTKSLMLACTYELVVETQLHHIRSLLFGRRDRVMTPTPPARLTPADGARLLVSYLGLDAGGRFLVGVQLSFLAMAHHDGPVGEAVASHQRGLREICAVVLEESGVPVDVVADESAGLWVLLVGLTAIVPGLAVVPDGDDGDGGDGDGDVDPDTGRAAIERQALLSPDEVVGVVCRHLEGIVSRHGGPGRDALDAGG